MMKTPPNHPAPKAEKRPHQCKRFGVEWSDDYSWLKDENWQAVMKNPTQLAADIRAHLDAENAYTEAVLAPLTSLKEDIFQEMKGRLEPAARSVARKDGDYAYFHFYREGDQHGVYARHKTGDDKPADEIILDADALAATQKGFFDIGDISHSPDHNWLAYSLDRKGAENFTVWLKNLGQIDAKDRSTSINKSAGSLVWAADNRTLFWVERDDNQRPYAVRFQDMFDPKSRPQTAYEESDPGFFVSIGQSDDRRFVEISAHNHTTSEIWRIPADAPTQPAICFAPRKSGLEYSLADHGGITYILTNAKGATDFAIMQANGPSASENWSEFIPHEAGTLILALESFEHFLVRHERVDALPRIVIRDMRSGVEHIIAMNEAAYDLELLSGYEYKTQEIMFAYASPTTPRQIFRYNMETRERQCLKTQVVPSGHAPDNYRTERLHITARDGQTIPVTLLRRKDVKADGSAPLLLYGYGSYGITISASFRTRILSLVDRGFVYVIAHIRGSMAKGYQWYLDGKLEKKTNTFHDFVDVGRALVDEGWTRKGRIIAHGGSAGGLLVGAAVNEDPELFGGAVAAVPFVDVLNTMSDAELPLTPPEWPEWGNPIENKAAFDQIRSYSPYDNVANKAYPPMFITGGLTDPRVTYWEPAKWTAKLREHQTGPAPILLKINMDAGHAGESGRYDSLKEAAEEYAFAVAAAGLV